MKYHILAGTQAHYVRKVNWAKQNGKLKSQEKLKWNNVPNIFNQAIANG